LIAFSTDYFADRQRFADFHWYPHDNGMVTVGMRNGIIKAWDMTSLQLVDLLRENKNIHLTCHLVSPKLSPSMALASVQQGLMIWDMRSEKVNMKFAQPHADNMNDWPTCLSWDLHRSSMIFLGSHLGQVFEWDLRYTKKPVLALPPFSNRRPSRPVKKIRQLAGIEGNLPSIMLQSHEQLFQWSCFQNSWSRKGEKMMDFEVLHGNGIVEAHENCFSVGSCKWENCAFSSLAVNQLAQVPTIHTLRKVTYLGNLCILFSR